MQTRLACSCFVIVSLLAPVAAHAADADSDRKHPAAYMEDSLITAKIKTKLAAEKVSSLGHIKVDTDHKGAVTLSGSVDSKAMADKAVAIARETEGVTEVKSTIRVIKEK